MTAAVRAQLLAHGAKLPAEPQKQAKVERTPPATPKEPREPGAAGRSQETAKPVIPVLPQAETRLIGPYALCLADPKHYPGRYRHTVTGPATPGLTDALEAALQDFIRLTQLQPRIEL